jgi:hypothetical protein
MRKVMASMSLFLLITLLLAACNLPRPTATEPGSAVSVNTAAALTVQAMSTQLSGGTVVSPVSAITVTMQPTVTMQLTPQVDSTAVTTSAPQATAGPSTTAIPPTPTPIPCDRGKFVSETIPDGTVVTPGASFTKTWTIKNDGSCTWNNGYALVFVSGDAMTGPASQQLTNSSVAPGQEVKISLDLKAPGAEGTFRGNWKLRNSAGSIFGLGSTADQPFWVEVKVNTSPSSLIDSYCLAQWSSDAGNLPCPGQTGDAKGFVIKIDAPRLEDGSTDNEPALMTNPQTGETGQITGHFEPIMVPSGARFSTVVGCAYDAKNCKVKFILKYIADNGPVQSLGEWTEAYDNKFTIVDMSLSSLAGKSVQFIFTVQANGSTDGNQALWLNPLVK